MNLTLDKVTKEAWGVMSESVHRYSFNIERPSSMDRIDYALVVRKEDDLICYSTIIELDEESVYMQHGGNFKAAEGTTFTLRGYLMMVKWLRDNYKNVSTRIFNKNKPMLKLAWAGGFTIVGIEANKNGALFLVLNLDEVF